MALTNSLPFIDDIQEIDMNEIEDWDLLSVDDVDLEEPGGFEFDPDEQGSVFHSHLGKASNFHNNIDENNGLDTNADKKTS